MLIKGLKSGSATITIQTPDGKKKAICKVVVTISSITYDSSVTQKYILKSSGKYVLKKEANNETYITVKTSLENVLSKHISNSLKG